MQFSRIVGQKEIKSHLINEVQSDKISHAQLFLGRPGYGTLPLALGFVQYIFCENRKSEDSCGECASCRKVETLQHPDLHFSFPTVQSISKTSDGLIKEWREQIETQPYFNLNTWIKKIDVRERTPIIGTEESHEIIKKLSLRSFEGGYKVMIIWMIGEMNASCSNKLLKIIEEPPNKTLFILISESQEKILPTILSRTQKLIIPRISLEAISQELREQYGINHDTADSVASRADGNLIEAMNLIAENVEQEECYQQFIQLMRACYKKNVLDMMDWSENIAGTSKEHQKEFLKYALHMFRQSILRNYTDSQLTRVSQEEDNFLQNFAQFITGNNILDFTEQFNNAHYYIERNANSKILFTNLCFDVMRNIHAA